MAKCRFPQVLCSPSGISSSAKADYQAFVWQASLAWNPKMPKGRCLVFSPARSCVCVRLPDACRHTLMFVCVEKPFDRVSALHHFLLWVFGSFTFPSEGRLVIKCWIPPPTFESNVLFPHHVHLSFRPLCTQSIPDTLQIFSI